MAKGFRVTSHESRVTSFESRVSSFEFRVSKSQTKMPEGCQKSLRNKGTSFPKRPWEPCLHGEEGLEVAQDRYGLDRPVEL